MVENGGGSATTLAVRVVEHRDGVRGLVVTGELDAAEAADVEAAAVALLTAGTAAIVIDLGGVRYFGSRGLTALLRVQRESRAAGVRLHVVTGAENRPVIRPLTITGLDRELDLFPTLAAALAS
ncbi:STAS domain-containing protein [Pseudonocardia abyssalis]|uniref:STAS domain-containing protein n=1 Tax=Pseudonocardia abyssalis TaxID=2792008 RepID=A0ABS6USX9_9PSEU|nr:STAS domain-containing protein [Pseudonocardia abyssalis]MBW0117218.1 STAS domain-containing protein [Pseudonocardia abyssalis]MBW0135287.1 STAS domain-containing protein [Pseudonocardia abyssalis]